MKVLLCVLSCIFISGPANADLVAPTARIYNGIYGTNNLSVTSIRNPNLTIFKIPVIVFENYKDLPRNPQGEVPTTLFIEMRSEVCREFSPKSAEILCDGDIVNARFHYPNGTIKTLRISGFDTAHINIERKTLEGLLGKRISYLASINMYIAVLGPKFSEATIDRLVTYKFDGINNSSNDTTEDSCVEECGRSCDTPPVFCGQW